MNVPLAVPNLAGREAEYLLECVESTFVSTAGPFVTRFEQHLAARSGTERASVMCSGTVALQMALEGLGIGDGDLVMVPSLTFIASTNAIRHSGARTWLVDCSEDDWTMDVGIARAAIESETEPHERGRRHIASGGILSAIMPVMVMGATIDFAAYVELARDYGLKVVVDAAAAIGATTYDDQALGHSGADAVCYSFNGNKTITSGGGGAVVSSDGALIDRINHLISTGRIGPGYDHDVVGYNFRMTNVEAAVGVAQIEQLDGFLARKRHVHERYEAVTSRYGDLDPFPTPARGRSTHWFSGFVYRGPSATFCPNFRDFMQGRGIDVRPFWKPVHLQVPYSDSLTTTMEVCEPLWDRIVPLPCSSGITDGELEHVLDSMMAFCDEHAEAAES